MNQRLDACDKCGSKISPRNWSGLCGACRAYREPDFSSFPYNAAIDPSVSAVPIEQSTASESPHWQRVNHSGHFLVRCRDGMPLAKAQHRGQLESSAAVFTSLGVKVRIMSRWNAGVFWREGESLSEFRERGRTWRGAGETTA